MEKTEISIVESEYEYGNHYLHLIQDSNGNILEFKSAKEFRDAYIKVNNPIRDAESELRWVVRYTRDLINTVGLDKTVALECCFIDGTVLTVDEEIQLRKIYYLSFRILKWAVVRRW